MRAALQPLRHRAFRRLAVAQAVSQLGDWVGEIALAVLVYERTGSALATAALFLGTGFAPALAAPFLAARIETAPPRTALPALHVLQVGLLAGLAAGAHDLPIAAVMALAGLDAVLAVAARVLTRACAGTVLGDGQDAVRRGNAVLNVGSTAAAAAGPALGGAVVALAGVQTALTVDCASFALAAMCVAFGPALPRGLARERGTLARLREGLRHVSARPLLRVLLASEAAAFVFLSLVIPIEVIYANESLGAGDFGYGALLASWGGGMVAGGLAFAAAARVRLASLLAVSTLAIAAAYLAMAAAESLPLACAASFAGGVGNGVQWVAAMTAAQALAGRAYQSRVIAVLESIGAAMPGLGFALGGVICALTSPRATFLAAGLGVALTLAVALAAARREAVGSGRWPPTASSSPVTATGPTRPATGASSRSSSQTTSRSTAPPTSASTAPRTSNAAGRTPS
jgi:MFS family permease